MLTQKRLKEVVTYNPETGIFVWNFGRPAASKDSRAGGIAKKTKPNDANYRQLAIDFVDYTEHFLVMLYMKNVHVTAGTIYHLNNDKTDNRYKNLVIRKKRVINKSMSKNNTSGVTGVNWCKRTEKWQASITVNGKTIFLGRHNNKEDAIKIRKQAVIDYGFEVNHGLKKERK